ncbi:MAG: hypothetical protein J1F35_06270 [Erysipelotrichales bacterium]|nr:hypothetical protein [Erysipelotrichales bacterium]
MFKIFKFIATELSDGIEKTTVGALSMFVLIGCIVYLVIKEGATPTVDSLMTTAMIVAATLMGVNSVTEIFKKTDNRSINIEETINTTTTNSSNQTNTTTTTKTEKITEGEDCECSPNIEENNRRPNGR